jgi:tetratricopeptide (TPR) repeat protein
MNAYAKLGGIAVAVALLAALRPGAPDSPEPSGSIDPPADQPFDFSFMAREYQLAAGLAFGEMGNLDAARDFFSRIRAAEPASALGYAPVAGTFLAQGQLIEALYWMREAQAVDPRNFEIGGGLLRLYDCLEDYEVAGQWSDWLDARVTKQPLPMAMQASHFYVLGNFELALQYSNLAIRFDLPDRWGSDAVFMRIKRDEALATGDPGSGISVFRDRYPGLFDNPPEIGAANISQATDLALLMKMAGRSEAANRLLNAVIAAYPNPSVSGGTVRPDLVPVRAEALAILGEQAESLAELRRIVDRGWRVPWRWKTHLNPNFDSVRRSPEFRAMVDELESDMAWQRSRVQAISVPGPGEYPGAGG